MSKSKSAMFQSETNEQFFKRIAKEISERNKIDDHHDDKDKELFILAACGDDVEVLGRCYKDFMVQTIGEFLTYLGTEDQVCDGCKEKKK